MKNIKTIKIGGLITWGLWLVFCVTMGLGGILTQGTPLYNFMVQFLAIDLLLNIAFTVIYVAIVMEIIKPLLPKE